MNPDEALTILRAHETELRALGIESLLLFGSMARGDATGGSDVDVVVRLTPAASEGGFAYFGRLDEFALRGDRSRRGRISARFAFARCRSTILCRFSHISAETRVTASSRNAISAVMARRSFAISFTARRETPIARAS